jgi:hypothetical protein
MHTIHTRRVGIAALGAVFTLGLAGCGGAGESTDSPTDDSIVSGFETTAIAGGDEFCDIAVESLAAEGEVNAAADQLTAALSDAELQASGDVGPLHDAGQQVVDNAALGVKFYDLGASAATDPAVKDAFTGLSSFVTNYSIPMGQLGVDATTYPEFLASLTQLFTDPELQPLLQSVSGWAATAHDFTVERCGIAG